METQLPIPPKASATAGKSVGPKQHFVHSIFRAIENQKYVIRAIGSKILELKKKDTYYKNKFSIKILVEWGNKIKKNDYANKTPARII